MNLLALETATEHCSVALLRSAVDGSHEVLVRRLHAPRQQTELILPMIDEVLAVCPTASPPTPTGRA